jgi:hypothetical protein
MFDGKMKYPLYLFAIVCFIHGCNPHKTNESDKSIELHKQLVKDCDISWVSKWNHRIEHAT